MKQYIEKAQIIAPGVVDQLDEWGNFEKRWYDGRAYDQNGDLLDEDDDDDDDE